jgi:hypothetical protein
LRIQIWIQEGRNDPKIEKYTEFSNFEVPLLAEGFSCSLSSQKYGFGIQDLRSGIRKKPIPDPGVKMAPHPGSWIRNTATIWYERHHVPWLWQSLSSAVSTGFSISNDLNPGPNHLL